MCSIIGYIGTGEGAPLLVKALKRMEYRGYDSAGVAMFSDGSIALRKGVGKVEQVNSAQQLELLPGRVGIGHTRWATHGGVNEVNAHPHLSWSGKIAIVHNGIIENYEELKADLGGRGYLFRSETDSEVIANLLQCNRDLGMTVEESVTETLRALKGKYAFVALMDDGTLVGARNHAPLILGIGRDGAFVSSDIMGFVEEADDVIYLDNSQFVVINEELVKVCDFAGHPVALRLVKVSRELAASDKGAYVHYTLKEIHDQPEVIANAGGSKEKLRVLAGMIKQAEIVYITGSGSSYNAALIGKHLLSKHAGIRVEPIISSEAQFSPMYLDNRSLLLAISQSGESADVLDAASIAKEHSASVASIVNVETSSLARLSAISVGLNCGPEIGVAATKSFTSQLAVLNALNDILCGGTEFDLRNAPTAMRKILADGDQPIRALAEELKDLSDIYLLGDGVHFFIACEAALKLKELAYVHAEAFPSGELKHGPLALLDPSSYVLAFNPSDSTYPNTLAAAHEVKARGVKIIGVSDRPNAIYDHWIRIPHVEEQLFSIIEILPIQLLAYHMAVQRKANPDYPRNLAKSVTVR